MSSSSGTEVTTLTGFQATVQNVIVAEQNFINSGLAGDPSTWIQCSYTNRIRNVYPFPGYIYDSIRDAFYPPQPYPSWTLSNIPINALDENNNIILKPQYIWISPTPYPNDGGDYVWNENSLTWEPLNT